MAWSSFIDVYEYVPDLVWPNSVTMFNQMRTDSQLAALWTAVMYGCSQMRFIIDDNGADPTMVEQISEDLNLPIKGAEHTPHRRMKKRFSHQKHLMQAFLALIYGHMYFEQVGEIRDGLWRLRKLAPRMPMTIGEIKVAPDGGLVSIKQSGLNIGGRLVGNSVAGAPEIPVDRLTAFIFQQEGANWVGRSMFRDCYKNWLIKDRLMRIDAVNHERAGGVPYAVGAPESTTGDLAALGKMMREFKIGETAGGAVPYGAKVEVARGTGSDVAKSIQMHDEAMARRFLLMVANLAQGGSHVGSYSLGEVFNDMFVLGQRAIVQWYCDVMNEHVIEDWVDWNYGEDTDLVPVLTWEGEEDMLGVEPLAKLVDSKIIIVDEELEDAIRYRYRLPKRSEPRPSLDELGTTTPPDAGGPTEVAPSPSGSPAKTEVTT